MNMTYSKFKPSSNASALLVELSDARSFRKMNDYVRCFKYDSPAWYITQKIGNTSDPKCF